MSLKKITKFDRATARLVANLVNDTLAKLGTQLGLNFQVGSGRFIDTSYKFRIEAAVVNASGVVEDKEVVEFKRFAKAFGLNPEDLGRKFTMMGKEYTITGMSRRRRNYPIAGKNANGRGFKFRAIDVVNGLKRAQEAEAA